MHEKKVGGGGIRNIKRMLFLYSLMHKQIVEEEICVRSFYEIQCVNICLYVD